MAKFYPVGIFALTGLGFMPNIALLDAVKATKFSPEVSLPDRFRAKLLPFENPFNHPKRQAILREILK